MRKSKKKVMREKWTIEVKEKDTAKELAETADVIMKFSDLMVILTAVVAPLYRELQSLRKEVAELQCRKNVSYKWKKVPAKGKKIEK